jgi:hypothetical protein
MKKELSFISNLDAEQIEYAMKVRQAADDLGVNPTLALAVVYQESRFRPKVKRGADGEVGLMQIKPSTAAGLGYSMQDILIPEKNIEAGLKYLKEALDVTGNDIRLAPIYYNGGPETFNKFASGQDYSPKIDKYLADLKSYNTFEAFDPSQLAEAKAPTKNPLPPVEVKDPSAPSMSFEERGQQELTRDQFGLYGGAAGAAGAAAAAAGPVATNVATKTLGNILGQIEQAKAQKTGVPMGALPAPAGALPSAQPSLTPPMTSGAPAGGLPVGDQTTRILQGTTGDQGTTGRARQTGYNVETSQQAAAKAEAEKIAQMLRQSGQVAQDAPEFFSRQPGMTSTPSGVLAPRSDIPQYVGARGVSGEVGGARAAEAAARPPYVAPPVPKPSGLEQAKGLFTSMMEKGSRAMPMVSKVAPYVAAPFAGYSLGRDVADMYMGYEQPPEERDYLDLGLTGLGALATAGSFTPAAPVAIPAAIAAPLVRNLRRSIMEKQQSPEEQEFISRQPTEEELFMATKPAFRYARP